MNALAIANPVPARPLRSSAPLRVEPMLRRFRSKLVSALARGGDDIRQARRRAVIAIIDGGLGGETDTIVVFEDVLNGCLDVGYRAQPLAAFVFETLQRRLAARVRRRLSRCGRDADSAEVCDLVAQAAEAMHRLIRGARRERHTLRYALLVSIADHRTIDYLRRRRPEYRDTMDDGVLCSGEWSLSTDSVDPERAYSRSQRHSLALQLRDAILDAVNGLSELERAAMVLVEIEGLGYPEVAARLELKRTDVGNLVRRARLARDRALVPRLRCIAGFEGHVGFKALQANRDLRLQMLRWTSEVDAGLGPVSRVDGYLLRPARA